MTEYTLGFIGGGNMARSLIGGLVPTTLDASSLVVGEPDADKRSELETLFGVHGFENNTDVVSRSDVVVIAVKPQVIGEVLGPLADDFARKNPLLISIVAGVRINTFDALLGKTHAIVRVMPNTPALVGRGASGMYAGPNVSDAQRKIAKTLMTSTGTAVWVPTEPDIDTVTALSGSGPAYFMLFVQALSDAAVAAGLDKKSAHELSVETAAGAAELIRQSSLSLDELIRNVTSPGGTTEKALESFSNNDFRMIVGEAFEAARTRSEELAADFAPPDTDNT